jgi:cystathionine gamma-synthase
VHYPGLESHPQHAIAARQQSGFGAMLSFELKGGLSAVRALVESLTCFTLAESLGGVESLISHPSTMTHASMSDDAKARAGLVDGLVRLSVGIEDLADLEADLRGGLERAALV